MIYILYFLLFMLGASLTSFICAKVYRENNLENGENESYEDKKSKVNKKRSFCDNCQRTLKWQELMPIFSYIKLVIFNKSKCKNCDKKINVEYFIFEMLGGALSLFTFLYLLKYSFINSSNFNLDINSMAFISILLNILIASIFSYFVIYLTYEDYKNNEVNSVCLYSFLFFSIIIYSLYLYFYFDIFNIILSLVYISPFLCIYVFSKGKWLGLADPIYFASLVLFFNTLNISASLNIFLYTIWSGAFISILYMYIKYEKYTRNISMPFLPFFAIGMLILLITDFYIIQIKDILILWNFIK